MWKEYVKMELGFIESMRRRWDVLGIQVDSDKAGKGKQKADVAVPSPDVMEGEDETHAATGMDVDEEEDITGFEARKQIMEGAIVKSVIKNAAQGGYIRDFYRRL